MFNFLFIFLCFIGGVLSATTPTSILAPPTLTTLTTPINFRSRFSNRRSTTTKLPISSTITSITERSIDVNNNDTCGVRTDDNHPWIAILEHTNPDDPLSKKTLSKGVLINSRYVLTTVSSLHHSHPFWIVSGIRLGDKITFGPRSPYHNSSVSSPTLRIEIDDVYIHPRRDIAVIKMSQAINISDSIQPICLPSSGNYNFRQLFLHVCKRQGSFRNIHLSSVLPIAPQDCTTLFRRQNSDFGPEEFCAWDEAKDDCAGDIGGPLIGYENSKFHVIGLNSFANFKEETNIDGLPGVYTRVWAYIKWINAIISHGDTIL